QLYMLVSNTSTLVLLAKITALEKFLQISPKITIPIQVKDEYSFEKESYYAKLIDKLVVEKKIIIENVNEKNLVDVMQQFHMDKGEAAAYTLYKRGKYKAVLTDDGELIKLCKLEQIPFICALAVVVTLYEKKVLAKNETLGKMEKLKILGRYSKEIYEHFIKEVK
ncbi:MAG: hypothetical protein HY513_00500, partial [Candidatus Aenigmarchaeota archaeon]|nr:hypothetical protein [Candidatus Aenigmarchaeota archaeon]